MFPVCPCGRAVALDACCGRYHHGEDAPTAEALMRSRHSVYAATSGGGPGDETGTVSFRAHHADGVVAEDSVFRRAGGRWPYVGPA